MIYIKLLLFIFLLLQVKLDAMEDSSNLERVKIENLLNPQNEEENKLNTAIFPPLSEIYSNFRARENELPKEFINLASIAVIERSKNNLLQNFTNNHIKFSGKTKLNKKRKKNYKCSWPNCDKSFERPSHLTIHKRIHTGEKPFICYYCEKTWPQKSALKVHVRTHTGEKPYSCPRCKKCFSTSSACNRHKNKSCPLQ